MNSILISILKETVLALFAKITFKTLAERFATRLVIYGLGKLKDYSTNEVVDSTVEDIIRQLQGKRLRVVDDLLEKQIH